MSSRTREATKRMGLCYERGDVELYTSWAPNFDEDYKELGCNGPRQSAEYFTRHASRLGLSSNSRILDVAAGTGLVAQHFKSNGFHNIEAVDGSQPMLDIAKSKNCYTCHHCCTLGGLGSLPMEDDTYDGVVMSGALYSSTTIPKEIFLDIIRVTKPGGLIVHAMKEDLTFPGGVFEDLHTMFDELEAKGDWVKLEHSVPQEKYISMYNASGILHVYQVGKNHA